MLTDAYVIPFCCWINNPSERLGPNRKGYVTDVIPYIIKRKSV